MWRHLYKEMKEEVCQCLQSLLLPVWKSKCYSQQKHSRSWLKTLNSSDERKKWRHFLQIPWKYIFSLFPGLFSRRTLFPCAGMERSITDGCPSWGKGKESFQTDWGETSSSTCFPSSEKQMAEINTLRFLSPLLSLHCRSRCLLS